MGLAADLEYEHRRPNRFHRAVAWLFATGPGAWVGKRVVLPSDKLVLKLSGGRATASDWLAALPPIWVTTTGRRSGQPRRIALYGIPIDDGLALIGSNYGHQKHPAWVHNLEANPEATVEYRGKSVRVRARPATEEEQQEILITAPRIYVGYAAYGDRAPQRTFRVFVLEPVPSEM